jgi:hypothetical protein
MPLVVGTGLLTATLIALLQRSYSRRITVLREDLKSRDDRLDELEKKLYLFKVNELQAKVANLKPQPRRRLTVQQKALLAEHARVPAGRQFTIEIIHDMAGSDCSAYGNDFLALLNDIGGWSISRSAVLGPGWVARCGLGVHVQSREILSRPETIVLNALAAAGVDYDIVRIPELDADVGLLVTPAPGKRAQPRALQVNGSRLPLDCEPK